MGVCVCVLMGGIGGSCLVSKTLRRGRSRPDGPLAVIHVKSLKTQGCFVFLIVPRAESDACIIERSLMQKKKNPSLSFF